MRHLKHCLLSVSLLACAGLAQASPVSLGIAGEFNLFSFKNVTSSGTSVQGAVAAGGNLTASNYSINGGNEAYAGDALVVGGKLSYQSGSISNGNAYVGGTRTTSSIGFSGKWETGTAPFSFVQQASQLTQLSLALAQLDATGLTSIKYGGMNFVGSDSSVEIFDITGADLAGVNYANFSHLATGSTVILNISGTSAGLQGGTTNGLANYNVLFNFFEATSLSFNNVGVYGSVLAPLATVNGGSGQISGNVIVADWNSNIALNDAHAFNTTEVAQYASLPGKSSVGSSNSVPEPTGVALFMLALALLGCTTQRAIRRQRIR